MRFPLVLAAIGIAALAVAYAVWPQPTGGGSDLAREKASAAGVYSVAIAPEKPDLRQGELHAWVLTLKTAAGTLVDDATIAVGGGMPAHGHGLPTAPEVTQRLGEGRYLIEGVRFSMDGLWELRFAISGPAGSDEVAFNIDI